MDTVEPTEMHRRANPIPWYDFWTKHNPTALELASAALEQCRRDRLDHAHKLEFHTGMTAMLAKREARLVADVQRLSRPLKKSQEEAPAE